ncbi:MAG: hypothetical protein Q7S40_25240 [Opitutaceae bacterium]|nr:hypothetical protein [Opitutaceae bacterium]
MDGFKAVVVILLTIIACVIFPPLLIVVVIWLAVFAVQMVLRPSPTQGDAVIATEQRRVADSTRAELEALANRAQRLGMTSSQFVSLLWEKWQIDFSIHGGNVNITEGELLRLAPHIPALKAMFNPGRTPVPTA